MKLGNIMIDCKDEIALREFYFKLLGWKKITLYEHPALQDENGFIFLFAQEEGYIPPVWPEQNGKQQKQMHFDFQVPDVWAAVAYAESLGAVRTKQQYGGDAFVTMLDPAGHPFCICDEKN